MRERVVLLSTWGGGHELPECRVLGWALVVMGRVNRAVRTRTARKVSQYFTNRVAHGMHRSRIHSRHPLPGIRRSAPASAIRATVACAPLWYFDFEWDRCTLKERCALQAWKSRVTLCRSFGQTQRSRTAVGRTDAQLDARWAAAVVAPRAAAQSAAAKF